MGGGKVRSAAREKSVQDEQAAGREEEEKGSGAPCSRRGLWGLSLAAGGQAGARRGPASSETNQKFSVKKP